MSESRQELAADDDQDSPRGLSEEELAELSVDPLLPALAMKEMRDPDEAADLLQDTLSRVVKYGSSFRGDSTPRTWAVSTMRNVANTRRMHRARDQFVEDIDEHTNWIPDHRTLNEDQIIGKLDAVREVSKLSGALSPIMLSVLLLFSEGYKHNEIAERIGITVTNSKVTLHRARKLARQVLDAKDES